MAKFPFTQTALYLLPGGKKVGVGECCWMQPGQALFYSVGYQYCSTLFFLAILVISMQEIWTKQEVRTEQREYRLSNAAVPSVKIGLDSEEFIF